MNEAVAEVVAQTRPFASRFASATCGPLKLQYHVTRTLPLSATDPAVWGGADLPKHVWFGIAALSSGQVPTSVEFLVLEEGHANEGFVGSQIGPNGQRIVYPPEPVPSDPLESKSAVWRSIDINTLRDGVGFDWAALGREVSPEAISGKPYLIKPVRPQVFRIDGKSTCTVDVPAAEIRITSG